MGVVSHGPPREILVELAETHNCRVFIETGTFRGGTTRWAASHFPTVHTIERSNSLYDEFSEGLRSIPGVTPHLGDSREILPSIIETLDEQPAIYWLDGHWSGGETAGEFDECPVREELALLASRPQDIILIDDAQLFLSAPPPPHNPDHWPTIADIVQALPMMGSEQFVQVLDDVIFIMPNNPELRQLIVNHAQERARLIRGTKPLKRRIQSMASKLVGRT